MPNLITATEFNALPELNMAELSNLGVLEPLLRDLRGAGLHDFEVKDKRTGQMLRVKPAEDLWAYGYRSPADLPDRDAEAERQWQDALAKGLTELGKDA